MIPILKEHKKKPYVCFQKKLKGIDTKENILKLDMLKNNEFDINNLFNFYEDLRKDLFSGSMKEGNLDFNQEFAEFADIFKKTMLKKIKIEKKKKEKIKVITWNFDGIKKDFARLIQNPVEDNLLNIQKNRLYDLIQSEIMITKFYHRLKKSVNENKSIKSFPGINLERFFRWKDLHFIDFGHKNLNKNTIGISEVIKNQTLKKDLNAVEFKDFFIDKRKKKLLLNIDFLKALAGRIVIASDGSFLTDSTEVQNKFFKWFKAAEKEPKPIVKQIEKGQEYLKIVSALKSDYDFDFSSSETISVAEDTLNNLIKNKKKKTDEVNIEEIKSVLKKPPHSKRTYFSIFAKKLRLQGFVSGDYNVLDYKEFIPKKSLEEGNNRFHIIRKIENEEKDEEGEKIPEKPHKNNLSNEKTENNDIWYYYVYEIDIEEEQDTKIILSGRMKYNPNYPYHQSLEILFKNLETQVYSYNGNNTKYPLGYLFDIFDHYNDLNKKYFNSYSKKRIEETFSSFRINDFSVSIFKKVVEFMIKILWKIKTGIKDNDIDPTDINKVIEANTKNLKGFENDGEIRNKILQNIEKIKKIKRDFKKNKLEIQLLESNIEILRNIQKKFEIKTYKKFENYFTHSNLSYFDFNDDEKLNTGYEKEYKILGDNNQIKSIIRELKSLLDTHTLLNRFRIVISYFDPSQSKFPLKDFYKDSFNKIREFLKEEDILTEPKSPSHISKVKKDKNFQRFLGDFKQLCFTDIPAFMFKATKDNGLLISGNFIGFTGLLTFPKIQIEPSGSITILNTWEKMYPRIQYGLPAINTTGVDLGLRTPVAIGDITQQLRKPDEPKSHFNIHYGEEKQRKIINPENENLRDFIISQSNFISKKNIDKAFYLQRISQKTQKRKARLQGKPFLQSSIKKTSLTDKQNEINRTAAHELASSIIDYAKTKTPNEKEQFKNIFKGLIGNEITNIKFESSFYPNFDNSLLRINTEGLLLSTKSGDPYATQKSQWLYGQIRRYLKESGQIQGVQIFNDTPPAYTSKLSHITQKEGQKGYLVKIEKIENLKKIIIKKSPDTITDMATWKNDGKILKKINLNLLVRNAILRHFNAEKWKGFKFIPLGSGNIFWLNPSETDETKKLIIDRDSNAAINIAMYNPFLYNANVINLQIDRIKKGESISKAQKIIKNKIMVILANLYKARGYSDDEAGFNSPYSYLTLLQVPKTLHKKIATTIYNGFIYHVNKPRTDEWKVKSFEEWIKHIEILMGESFGVAQVSIKDSDAFINLFSAAFTDLKHIDDIRTKFPYILKYFEEKFKNRSYGAISSLMDIKKINKMIKKKNPDENQEEEIQKDQKKVKKKI